LRGGKGRASPRPSSRVSPFERDRDRPKLLIADSLKGAGVSFMEPHPLPEATTSLHGFHSGAPSPEEYERGPAELEARLAERLEALGLPPAELRSVAWRARPRPRTRSGSSPPTARRSWSRRSASPGWWRSTRTSCSTPGSCRSGSASRSASWSAGSPDGPVYIRLVSVPWELGFDPPAQERLVEGRGTVIRDGEDALFVAAGPVMVSQAFAAAERLDERGIRCGVVALPWLRGIDGAWVAELAGEAPIFCLDNHYSAGGQGDALLAALGEASPEAAGQLRKLAVEEVPRCGTNDEVLSAHRLDAASVAERVQAELGVRA
jgi:hypothetical protein